MIVGEEAELWQSFRTSSECSHRAGGGAGAGAPPVGLGARLSLQDGDAAREGAEVPPYPTDCAIPAADSY